MSNVRITVDLPRDQHRQVKTWLLGLDDRPASLSAVARLLLDRATWDAELTAWVRGQLRDQADRKAGTP